MPESETDLRKLFQSSEELEEPEKSTIQGKLPPWLCGKFITVGPGLFDLEDFTLNHWLDGYAILSKFDIRENVVTFQKKYLQSDAYKRAIAAKKPVITEFGTKAYPDPNKGLLARIVSSVNLIEMTDNDSSNIFKLGKDYFVCNDSCFFRKFDTETLSTGDKFDSQRLFGLNGLSAHPLLDEETGDLYNIGFSVLTGLKFSVIRIPSTSASAGSKSCKELLKDAKVLCSINSSYGAGCVSYVHSFGMTSKYILFIEQPYVASISAIASALIKGHSVKDWLEWRPRLPNRFHLIEKASGKVIKTEIVSEKPFFFLHIVNCYVDEEYDQMVVDIMALDDPGILDGMFLCKLRNNIVEDNAQPSGRRFVIPLSNHKELPTNTNLVKDTSATAIRTGASQITLTPDIFTQPGCEMPVINRRFTGRKHKFIYVNGTIAQNMFRNKIGKINVEDKSCMFWSDGDNEYVFPGEPVFVPNPGNGCEEVEEDDGILIAAMSNVKKGEDDILVFIHAKNMKEIARVGFKAHIPGALHGVFVQS